MTIRRTVEETVRTITDLDRPPNAIRDGKEAWWPDGVVSTPSQNREMHVFQSGLLASSKHNRYSLPHGRTY